MNNLVSKTRKVLISLLSLVLVLGHFSGMNALATQTTIQEYSSEVDQSLLERSVEDDETQVIFNLRDYLAYAAGGIGEGHFDFSVTDRIQPAGNVATFTVVDRGGSNYLSVTGRTADWHAIDIIREGLQAGDTITVNGRTVQAATVALDGAEAPHPWWRSVAVGADSDFELVTTIAEEDLENPGLVRFRLRTRGTEDFYIYNILITRADGNGDGGGDNGGGEPTEDTLMWSFAADEGIQGLEVGHSGIGGYFDDVSPAMLVSGDPLVTVVDHPTVDGQIGLELSQRAQNWHALDFMFPEVGVVRGGTYRFVARGRIAAGAGNRNIIWNQTDAPWQELPNARTVVPGAVTTWEVEVTLDRYAINTALNAGQRGVRLQTGNAPTVTLTIDDVFVYQVGDINTDGLPLPPEWDLDSPSLADLFAPYFGIGNIYSTHSLMDAFDTRSAFLHHFNVITAENGHKPDHIAGPGNRYTVPTPEEFNFTSADQIVNFAVENDIQLVGHALVWHGQSPNWLFRNPDGTPLARAEAIDRMEFYMRTLSEHFAEQGTLGAFYSWDVVNEAIASGGGTWTGDWRNQMRTASPWFQAFNNGLDVEAGEHASDFIWYAFYFARQYFPYSILYYNDYNEEIPAKRNAIAQMVEDINERWANHPSYDGRLLIEAIGMQSHYHITGWTTNFNNVSAALDRFIETGARVSVTELDITYGGHGAPAFPYLTEAQLQRQAEAYARIFGYYLERANYLSRVSIWGMADHNSWRSSGFPLLFDSNFNAKPAFNAIVDLVENWETPEVMPPTFNTVDLDEVYKGDRIFTLLEVARECNAPIWFNVVEGNLPAGVTLHTRTGILEGAPLEAGIFTFSVEVSNYGGTTIQEFTLVVLGEPSAYDITGLSIAGIEGAIDQEAQTITFTVPEDMIFHHPTLGAQLRGSITELEAISDALLFYVTGHDWPYSLLRLGDWVGVGTGNTVRVEGGIIYTIILNLPGLECKVIAYGQFANQAGVDGLVGSEWRLCDDGTLEIDEGFINWTLYQGPWAAYVGEIDAVVITGPITAGASLRSLFRDFQVTEIEGLTHFDTTLTRNMENMFRNATAIVELDLSSFDISNVTNMQRMFTSMRALRALTLGAEFSFMTNAGLPVLAHGDGYTGMWQNGEFIFTSAQLMSQFDGHYMAGTFVWQVWEADVCEVVVARGRFAHQAAAQGGVAGAEWRLCEDGTLEIDEGFINWTLYNGPWHNYRNEITDIVITGPITAGSSLRSLFRDLNDVTEIEGLTYFDTSRTTSMQYMFRTSTGITELDLSSFDSSNVTNMHRMFTNMRALEYVDFGENFTPADNAGLPAHLRP